MWSPYVASTLGNEKAYELALNPDNDPFGFKKFWDGMQEAFK